MERGIRCLSAQFYTFDQLSERREGRPVRGDGRGFVLTAAGETHCSYEDGVILAAHRRPAQALLATLYPWASGTPQSSPDMPSVGELAVAEINAAGQSYEVCWKAYDRRLCAASDVGLATAVTAGSSGGQVRDWRQLLWLWRFRELGDRLNRRPEGSLTLVPYGLEGITDRHIVLFPVVDEHLPEIVPSRWRSHAERLLGGEPKESILFRSPEADLNL